MSRIQPVCPWFHPYEVEPRALVQAVKRNAERFPEDFMFQLTMEEFTNLKSQIVISNWRGLRRIAPEASTSKTDEANRM